MQTKCGQAVDTPDKKCVLTITKHGDRFMKNKRNLISLLFTFLMPIVLLGQSVVGVCQ